MVIKQILRLIIDTVLIIPVGGLFLLNAIYKRLFEKKRMKPNLLFGPIPIINNKYWSKAMNEKGYYSRCIMFNYYHINDKEDFDMYYEDFKLKYLGLLNYIFVDFLVFIYTFNKFDIYHFSFNGGILQRRYLFRYLEFALYKIAGKKTIILPYGSDIYLYSKIIDIPWKHSLLIQYPELGKNEQKIEKRVKFIQKTADFIIAYIDYVYMLSFWNMLTVGAYTIDEEEWSCDVRENDSNGLDGLIRIAHAPNHRGVKGTEFVIDVINSLKNKGYLIELVLIENMKNREVKEVLKRCDILIDQLNLGYAMNAIEGMALSMPVITNLTNKAYIKVFEQYAYLQECPLVSSDYKTLYNALEELIQDSEKRKRLGMSGREYVSKYHSKKTAYLMFSRIYENVWFDAKNDLINYFHPLIGQFQEDYKRLG